MNAKPETKFGHIQAGWIVCEEELVVLSGLIWNCSAAEWLLRDAHENPG